MQLPEPGSLTPEDIGIPIDGDRVLRAWHWRRPEPRGTVAIAHGLGEHGGAYRHVAELIATALDLDVLALDFRGHGRSFGRRGVVDRFSDLADDLLVAVDRLDRARPDLPRFVLGHSMGGLVAILAALREPARLDGLIASNPALRLKFEPPRWKLLVGRVLRRVAPRVTLGGPLPIDGLTRDPLMQAVLLNDRLIHTRVSAPLYFGMLEDGAEAIERAAELRLPTLLILGGDDPIIDPASGRALFDRLGAEDRTRVEVDDLRHVLFFERGRERIFAEVVAWLEGRLAVRERPDGAVAPGLSDSA